MTTKPRRSLDVFYLFFGGWNAQGAFIAALDQRWIEVGIFAACGALLMFASRALWRPEPPRAFVTIRVADLQHIDDAVHEVATRLRKENLG